VTLNLFPGTYQDRLEDSNIDHDGVISAMEATNLVLEYNVEGICLIKIIIHVIFHLPASLISFI
jgi:hypothetical protein